MVAQFSKPGSTKFIQSSQSVVSNHLANLPFPTRVDILGSKMVLKLHDTIDSLPCTSVRMAVKHLNLTHELIKIDMEKGEHQTEEFLKVNPMGQVPCMDDDGFILTESVAILQYLAEKYGQDETLYPPQLQKRAIVHQRLAFHLSSFYPAISNYFILPLIFGVPQTGENKDKLSKVLTALEKTLAKQNATFVAGNDMTIADLPMIMGMVCCEVIGKCQFEEYPTLKEWYDDFKRLAVWAIAQECMKELQAFVESKEATD